MQTDTPLVIVGAGPIGVRAAVELRQALPQVPIVLYGDGPWQPYNRVRLSSLLAGDADWADFTDGLALPEGTDAEVRAAVDYMISTFNTTRTTP